MRRLPFYSELLSSLGPVAARELTAQHDDDVNGVFEIFHFSDNNEKDFSGYRTRTAGRVHQAGEQLNYSSSSSSKHRSTTSGGGALDITFEREMETIELALRRREVLGVERWLQLQRCSAPVYRVRCS